MKAFLLIFSALLLQIGCGNGPPLFFGTGFCEGYSASVNSIYSLPYAEGKSFRVGQGNCSSFTHIGDNQYAYDFSMDIGTPVYAARAGTVLQIKEDEEDNNGGTSANFVRIQHDDQTIAIYAHLTQMGVTSAGIKVGDLVAQGEPIAFSGNTGFSTGAHLHFEVKTPETDASVPITFKNTAAHVFGLREGHAYEAYSLLSL